MKHEIKNIATLCVEVPLRMIPETARVLENLGRNGSNYCRQSTNNYRIADTAFTMLYHGSRFVNRTSTAFLDAMFLEKSENKKYVG